MNLWNAKQRIIAMTMALVMLPWSSFCNVRFGFNYHREYRDITASDTDATEEIINTDAQDTNYPADDYDIDAEIDSILDKYNAKKAKGIAGTDGDEGADSIVITEFDPFDDSFETINYNYTLEEDVTIDGSLVVESGELNLNGHNLSVNGDIVQKAGKININGGTLTVNGSYRMQNYRITDKNAGKFEYDYSNAYLVMNNSEDVINVKKNLIIWNSAKNKGNLNRGVLNLEGNLEIGEYSSADTFVCWSDFKLCFTGENDKSLTAYNSKNIVIANLELDTSGTIRSDSEIKVTNSLISDIDDKYEGTIIVQSNSYNSLKGTGFSGDLKISQASFEGDYTIGGNLICTGNFSVDKNKTLTVCKDIDNQAQISVNGSLVVDGNYNVYFKSGGIDYGTLNIYDGKALIKGNATFNGGTAINFNSKNAEVTVLGDFISKCQGRGDYSKGTLYVGGDFIADTFTARADNTVVLCGDKLQTIDVSGVCKFGKIKLENFSSEGVVSKNIFTKDDFDTNNCNFKYDGFTGVEGYVLNKDEVIDGDLVIVGGEMDLNGRTLTVKGDLILMSGTLNINKGTLKVEKDFRQQTASESNGEKIYGLCDTKIIMNNPEDVIEIDGGFYNSLNKGLYNNISNGTIKLGGDYISFSGASDYCFYPFTDSKLILSRNDHYLKNNSSYNSSTISLTNLYVEDDETVTGNDKFYISGSNLVITSSIYPGDAIFKNKITIDKKAHIIGDSINANIVFNSDIEGVYNKDGSLVNDDTLTINGDVSGTKYSIDNKVIINGNLSESPTINKNVLINGNLSGAPIINADVTVNGTADTYTVRIGKAKLSIRDKAKILSIEMMDDRAFILSEGDFSAYGSINGLSKGTVEIKGNADISGYFNKVILSGNKKQTIITHNNTDIVCLEFKNTSKEGVYSEGILGYKQIIKNSTKLYYSYGNVIEESVLTDDITYEGDCFFVDGVLDLNGHTLTIDGNLNHLNGTIKINGGKLLVKGNLREIIDTKYIELLDSNIPINQDDFRVSKGVIVMQNPEDVLDIDGNLLLYNDSTKNQIKEGKVYVGGNFKSCSIYNLEGNTDYIFDGKNDQKFQHHGKISSMKINTKGKFDVSTGSYFNVVNGLSSTCDNITGRYINVNSLNIVEDGFKGDILLTGEDKLGKDVQINGNLKINSKLDTNGHSLYAQSMTIEADKGCLVMDNDSSYIGLSSYLSISGKNTTLTAGTIELCGYLDVSAARNLKAAGSNRIIVNKNEEYVTNIVGPKSADSKLNSLILRGHEPDFQLSTSPEKTANEIIYEYETKPIYRAENILISDITATSVKLSFEDRNVDVVSGYRIIRNGEIIGVTSSTEYVDKNLTPETDYEYKIVVFGKYGDLSPESETKTITTLKDKTAPTAPDGIKIKSRSGKAITIAWWKSYDDVGVEGYRIYRDGELIADLSADSFDEDSEGYISYRDEDGYLNNDSAYIYEIESYDMAGNSNKSDRLSVQLAVPKIIRISPNDSEYLIKGINELKITFRNYGVYSKYSADIEYRYFSENDSEFKKINKAALTHKPSNSKELTLLCPFYTSELKENRIIVRYTLTDIDGCAISEYVDYYIDNTAPQSVKIKNIEDRSGVVKLMWDVSIESDVSHYDIFRYIYHEDDEEMVYKLIGSTSSVNNNSYEDSEVEEGDEIYYIVSAVDYSGNHSELKYPESITIGHDSVPPEVSGMNPSAGRVSDIVHITASAKDNKSVGCIRFYCRWSDDNESKDVFSNGTENDISDILSDDGMLFDTVSVFEQSKSISAKTEWDTNDIPDGIYQVKAVAVDASGNESIEVFTRRYTVDNTGIAAIENINATAGSTYAQLTWDDVTENDFSYFSVLQLGIDGEFSEVQRVYDYTGCTIDGLEPQKNYSFKIAGVDDLGNVGEYSDVIKVKTVRDDKPPIINSIYPAPCRVNNALNLVISAKDNASLKEAVWSWSFDGKNFIELARQNGEGTSFDYRYTFDISDQEAFPEGIIFIKSECFDAEGNKNALMKDDQEIVAEYIIDRTAPVVPRNLSAKANEGNIELSWDMGSEEDIASYRIYKAEKSSTTGGFGIYRKVADVESLNYFDTNIESGKAYSYQIECIDIAGNISGRTESVYVTAMPDNTIPEVRGVSPKDMMTVGTNAEITYLVTDNSYLGGISVYMRESSSDNDWNKVYENNKLSGMYVQESFKYDFSDYEEGLYEFKFEVKDRAGNRGNELVRTYRLDKTPCEGTIKAEDNDNKNLIKLNLDMKSSLDYSHFEVFRCEFDDAATDWEFKMKAESIGVSYNSDLDFEDKTAVSGVRYKYAAKIYDKYGNTSWSEPIDYSFVMKDMEAPVIISADKITAIAGRPFMLSAGASTDNVKIKSYTWDVGDKVLLSGAYTEYKYDKAGKYEIKLTVTDSGGNSSDKTINVDVKDNNNSGLCKVVVTDSSGRPLPYANVYINAPRDKDRFFMTDERGELYLAYKAGKYKIAAYKDGYLPGEEETEILNTETSVCTIALESGEVVVGDFEIHRMSLQEIIDSGADISDPANLNTFTFKTTLTFEKRPIPVIVEEIPGEIIVIGNDIVKQGGATEAYFGEGGQGPSDSCRLILVDQVVNGNSSPAPVPVVVTLQTTQTVSWLKTMYAANLTIMNAADSKYVIEDAVGSIELPDGVSLVHLGDGTSAPSQYLISADTEKVDMGSIAGQEMKRVSWVIKGDKSGAYKIKARFDGTLMPFDVHVEKAFVAEQEMEVEQSDVEILIMPESAAYIGENYYIQYAITNKGNEDLYNFKTSIGDYQHLKEKTEVFIMDPKTKNITSTETSETGRSFVLPMSAQIYQTPVLSGDDEITIPTLKKGQTIFGTWCLSAGEGRTVFTGDYQKEYYELTESIVDVIEGENLGVKVKVVPIDSHITKYISTVWKGLDDEIVLGDPVDLTSGAFRDNYTALALIGRDVLSLDMQYDSVFAKMCENETASQSDAQSKSAENTATESDALLKEESIKNTCGYGWYNDFDTWIEEKNGIVHFYINPYVCVPFISESSKKGEVFGAKSENGVTLADMNFDTDVHFVSIYANTEGYDLVRHSDGSYLLETPSGAIFHYDSLGRFSGYVSEEGSLTTITYTQREDGGIDETITEEVSGNMLILSKDKNGRLDAVSDNAGRVSTFSYDDNGNLIAIINPLGEKISYSYESGSHFMTRSEDNEGGLIVENSYDKKGRVISQKDSAGSLLTFDYEAQKNGGLKTTVGSEHDGTVDITTVYSNNRGFITYGEDKTGSVSYEYDANDNLLHLESSNGTWINYTYDENGKITGMRHSSGSDVKLIYDKSGNIIEVSSSEDKVETGTVGDAHYAYDEKGRVTEGTAYGNTVRYTYDEDGVLTAMETVGRGKCSFTTEKGRLSSYTNELGATVSMTYDSYGNINSVTNPSGGVTRYTYDAMDRLISVENPYGGISEYTYNSLGMVTSQTDPIGYKTLYQYDTAGRCTGIKYPDDSEISLEYDMLGRLIEKIFPDGTTEKYSYDVTGKISSIEHADGTTENLAYNDKGILTELTDSIGNVTGYSYDENGRLTKLTAPNGMETDIHYTGENVTSISSGDISTSVTYNSLGLVDSETDPLGNATKYEYDSFGNMISGIDPKGNRTEYGYDVIGRCTDVTYANGLKVEQDYDLSGNVTSIHTVVAGKEIKYSYEYDKAGQIIATTDESGRKTEYTYDKVGRVTKAKDEFGNYAEYTYDCMGRLSEESDNLGNCIKYEYDVCGNLIHVTSVCKYGDNEQSKNYTYTYDKAGRLLNVSDPSGRVTSQNIDKLGQITSVTDAMGGVTECSYDRFGNLIEVKNPVGNITKYEYDSYGNLIKSIDGRGNITEYSYDKCGRISELNDAEGNVKYSYDANGNLITVSDKSGTITRTYDEMNRVTSYTDCNGNTIGYGYDELGNILSIAYPGGEVVRYTYNPDGTLAEMSDGSGRKTIYGYDRQGRLTTTTRPDGSVESLSYDERSNVVIREDKATSGAVLQRYEYSYDESGNITSIKESVKKDSEDELKDIEDGKTAGNMTVTTSMEYDSANRLIRYNGIEVKYDADGNMIYGPLNGEMVSFTYDSRNRLTMAGGVKYTYDAENIRISAESEDYYEEYITDSESVLSKILEIRSTDKTNTDNIVKYNKSVTTCYYGIGLVYDVTSADDKQNNNAGDIRVYHYDHLGSTRYITDKSGKITLYFEYGTFGEFNGAYDSKFTACDISALKIPVRFLYNGEYGVSTDSNGLLYMRQRYYNTDIKRFINQDILTGSITDSQSLNRYSYVEGNPVSFLDPFGLSKLHNTIASIRGAYNIIHKALADPFYVVNNAIIGALHVWKNIDDHTKLNILGTLPVIGYVFDIANAISYFKDGNVEQGIESLIFALPTLNIAGGAGTIAKLFTSSQKTADAVGNALQLIGSATAAFTATAKMGNGIADIIDTYLTGGADIDENFIAKAAEVFSYALMTSVFGSMAIKDARAYIDATQLIDELMIFEKGKVVNDEEIDFIEEQSYKQDPVCGNSACFVAGTKVKTVDGEKNIEDIQIGDEVYACDVETGEVGLKKVKQTFVHEEYEIVHVTVKQTTIDTTIEHPFYVEGYGFKPAGELQPGDKVRLLDGTYATVEKLTIECLEQPIYVYNFEVEDVHTYYVSSIGVLVHNDCAPTTSEGGSGVGSISTPNSGQGFSPNGYNPQPGERTLDGYVKNHASPEISLHTDSAGFNNNNGNVGGDFKRFGAESHGGVSPHVHQPQRNVAPNGNIYGTVGTKTANGGVTSPSKKDVKQLYEYLTNGKYH